MDKYNGYVLNIKMMYVADLADVALDSCLYLFIYKGVIFLSVGYMDAEICMDAIRVRDTCEHQAHRPTTAPLKKKKRSMDKSFY